ncbi:MAG TPA: hypothetical protein VIU65_12310 [Pyrinomonadaceae bacterium]
MQSSQTIINGFVMTLSCREVALWREPVQVGQPKVGRSWTGGTAIHKCARAILSYPLFFMSRITPSAYPVITSFPR